MGDQIKIYIPPCPSVLGEITHLYQQPDPDFRQLAHLIQQDAALAAAVLQAAYNTTHTRNIASILQAIQILGLDRVQQVCLSVLLRSEFGTPAGVRSTLWDELRVAAECCERFAKRFRGLPAGTAYTLGLLHDTGIFLMARSFAGYDATTALARGNPHASYTDIEQRRHQTDHATVGLFLARRWGLKDPIPEIIGCHHDYRLLKHPTPVAHGIAYLVIADRIAGELVGIGADHEWDKSRAGIAELLGMDEEDLINFVEMETDLIAEQLHKRR